MNYATDTEHRKLAAIMFTDMVGYSALSQSNEALALELLEEHRQLLRPIFASFGGNEIETAGDSFFVEFASALEAAQCAIEIQRTLFERNSSLPVGRHIRLRIGLHLGDVVHKGHHVHGDGVNIAARLEPLAEPGCICISEDVARQVQNKIDAPLRKLGKGELKNIQLPMEVYKIVLPWEKGRLTSLERLRFLYSRKKTGRLVLIVCGVLAVGGLLYWQSAREKPIDVIRNRVAVLPFANLSPDPSDEYFADGMTEELISSLSKISGLNVIARTSVMKYKGMLLDVAEIGEKLNVGSILEGSVRKFSDKARITVQLIDVATQEHRWSQDYDRKLEDVFAIQSDIAQRVVQALKLQLLSEEKRELEKQGTDNLEAYQLYLLGLFHFNRRTVEELQMAIEYFEQAIGKDPNYAVAYAGLANCYTLIGGARYGDHTRGESVQKAKNAVRKALELDETVAEAHAAQAYIYFRLDWNWAAAEEEFKQAIQLKPGYAMAREWYALYLSLQARFDEALNEMQRAQQLDPLSASVSTGLGRIYQFMGKHDKAIEQHLKTLSFAPNYAEGHFALGMAYFQRGMVDKAIQETKKAHELSGHRTVIASALGYMYAKAGKRSEAQRLIDQIRSQFSDEREAAMLLSMIYAGLDDKKKALELAEIAYQERDGVLVYIKVDQMYQSLRTEPLYLELIKKIGLE